MKIIEYMIKTAPIWSYDPIADAAFMFSCFLSDIPNAVAQGSGGYPDIHHWDGCLFPYRREAYGCPLKRFVWCFAQWLFDQQYELTLIEEVEIQTRTEI